MILVTGATGNIGSEVMRSLVVRGHEVKALCRNPDKGRWPKGVTPVAGDLNDAASVSRHLRKVEAMFLMPGYDGAPEILNTAAHAGVERVTLLSANSAVNGDLDNVVSRYHVEAEQQVRESSLPWTILRPVSFMSNTLQWVDQVRSGDVIREPFADVPVAVIDAVDIGATAAESLISNEHIGATLRLTGPKALYPADRVRILGDVLDRDLELVPLEDDEARESLQERMTPPYIDAFFDFFRSGKYDEATLSSSVTDVTGATPRPFDQWARDNATAFE